MYITNLIHCWAPGSLLVILENSFTTVVSYNYTSSPETKYVFRSYHVFSMPLATSVSNHITSSYFHKLIASQ